MTPTGCQSIVGVSGAKEPKSYKWKDRIMTSTKRAGKKNNSTEESVLKTTEDRRSAKRGIRDRYYIAGAICTFESDDGEEHEIVSEAIKASSAMEAREIFKRIHDVEPTMFLDGSSVKDEKGNPIGGCGFYVAMGTGMSSAQRVSVTVTPEQLIRHTGLAFKAKLQIDGREHPLCGNGLKATKVKVGDHEESFKDNELCSVIFNDMYDGDKKIPKPKLKRCEVVRYSDLKEIEQIG